MARPKRSTTASSSNPTPAPLPKRVRRSGRVSSSSSSDSDHLLHLILRVLELEGYPLAPFLTLQDLWNLSLAASSLLPYRTLLPRVQLTKPATFRDSKGRRRSSPLRVLTHVLTIQRAIHHIRINEAGLLKTVLQAMKVGAVPTLRSLDLSRLRMNQNEAKLLASSLKHGVLHKLEALDLSRGISFHGAASLDLIAALSEGACPKIRHLNLSYGFFSLSLGESLAGALHSGHLRSLTSLDLSSTYMGPQGAAAVAGALKLGLCPELRILNINHAHAGGAIQSLGEALAHKTCQRLEELKISGNMGVTAEALSPLMEALRTGCCPSIAHLALACLGLDHNMGMALAGALAAGKCINLRGLELGRNRQLRDDTVIRLVEVVVQGACPKLSLLDLCETGMKRGGALALARAITGGSHLSSTIEDLRLSGNPIPKRDMTSLVKALGSGTCRRLNRLDLADINMREGMGRALAQALVSGSLPKLASLSISDNNYLKDRHVATFLKVLADHGVGACPSLTRLDMSFTGIGRAGCAALGRALQEGALANLQALDLSRNGGITMDLPNCLANGAGGKLRELDLRFGGEREVMKRLAQVLKGGACPELETLRVLRYSMFFPEFEQAVKARSHNKTVVIE